MTETGVVVRLPLATGPVPSAGAVVRRPALTGARRDQPFGSAARSLVPSSTDARRLAADGDSESLGAAAAGVVASPPPVRATSSTPAESRRRRGPAGTRAPGGRGVQESRHPLRSEPPRRPYGRNRAPVSPV